MKRYPHQLPTFRGYVIDNRLREFRRIAWGPLTDWIVPFESPKGKRLREAYRRFLQKRQKVA